jgi:hypothetical protein
MAIVVEVRDSCGGEALLRAKATTKENRREAGSAEKGNTNCKGCPVPLRGTGRSIIKSKFTTGNLPHAVLNLFGF